MTISFTMHAVYHLWEKETLCGISTEGLAVVNLGADRPLVQMIRCPFCISQLEADELDLSTG